MTKKLERLERKNNLLRKVGDGKIIQAEPVGELVKANLHSSYCGEQVYCPKEKDFSYPTLEGPNDIPSDANAYLVVSRGENIRKEYGEYDPYCYRKPLYGCFEEGKVQYYRIPCEDTDKNPSKEDKIKDLKRLIVTDDGSIRKGEIDMSVRRFSPRIFSLSRMDVGGENVGTDLEILAGKINKGYDASNRGRPEWANSYVVGDRSPSLCGMDYSVVYLEVQPNEK